MSQQPGLLPRPLQSLIYPLPAEVELRVMFALSHRRIPHFGRPVTFSDKINWRMLNDRRPLLEWTCDKLAMKDHVLKEAPAGLHVPRTASRLQVPRFRREGRTR